MKILRLIMLFALLFPLCIVADDIAPPWFRGEPLSVMAAWDFATAPDFNLDIVPDSFSAIPGSGTETLFGDVSTHAEVVNPSNWQWVPAGGRGGITPIVDNEELTIDLQNWVDDEPFKYIRIQFTGSISFGLPFFIGFVTGFDDQGPVPISAASGQITDLGNGRIHQTSNSVLQPNPDWEQISIPLAIGSILEEIIVDTVSLVPEPATVCFLAIGGFCLLLRRKSG
jgi:hypothetical protein